MSENSKIAATHWKTYISAYGEIRLGLSTTVWKLENDFWNDIQVHVWFDAVAREIYLICFLPVHCTAPDSCHNYRGH